MNEEPSNENPGDNTPKKAPGGEPSSDQVYKYLMFGLSFPERAIRSTAAMVSGAISESASLLVPQAFQDSKTYQTFVQQMLDVVATDVGGVKKEEADGSTDGEATEDQDVEDFVAKKAVSTFVDLAGMAALHVSPMTVLAIISDVAYGSSEYLDELARELKREGVIAEDSTIANTADLLTAIGEVSSGTADALDLPPLSIEGLQETILKTQENVAQIDPSILIPKSEIDALWQDMTEIANQEQVNLFSVSSAITLYTLDSLSSATTGALTTVRVTGEMLDRHLIEHYRQGVKEIYEKGLFQLVADSSEPYIDAVWYNFSAERPTLTEDIVSGKMVGRVWDGVVGWLGGDEESKDSGET